MPGRLLRNADLRYAAAERAKLQQFPVDQHNLNLAALAVAAGIEHVLDPAFYAPATGVARDLNTGDGEFTSAHPPAVVAAAGTGAPLFDFEATASNRGFDGNFAKVEASWSIVMFLSQAAADQNAAGNKVVFAFGGPPGSGPTNYLLSLANGIYNLTMAGLTNGLNFNLPPGSHVLLLSYDDASKSISVRDEHDNVLGGSAAFTATPTVGGAWSVGGISGGFGFQGLIGQVLLCSEALHLAANDDARHGVLALLRDKYGLA